MDNKEFWIFTFDNGTAQKIYANSYLEARIAMWEEYGVKWSFQYSQKEWESLENDKDRYYHMERILDNIIYAKVQGE